MLPEIVERAVLISSVVYLIYLCLALSVQKWGLDLGKWKSTSMTFPIKALHNQGIYLVDTHQVHLSESYAPLDLLYYGSSDKENTSVYNEDGHESTDFNRDSEILSFILAKVTNDTFEEVNQKCSGGFLSEKVISSEKLTKYLEEIESEYSKKGFGLSIAKDSVEVYYLTQGLVISCEIMKVKVDQESEPQKGILVHLGIPLVRKNSQFKFKRIVSLQFQNSIGNSLCSSMKTQSEYVLMVSNRIILIPTTKYSNNDTAILKNFDKCRVGPELHLSSRLHHTICHLDLKTVDLASAKMSFDPNYYSCIKAIHERNSRDLMEKHCQLDNCVKAEEAKLNHYTFLSREQHVLMNIQKQIKIRCTNKLNDATVKYAPADGTVLFVLPCGCRLILGNTILAKMERCNSYSKTKKNRENHPSHETLRVFQLLPSNHLKDFYGYVHSVKYITPINSIFIIKIILFVIEIYLIFFGFRLSYLIFVAVSGGGRLLCKTFSLMDLIGFYYILLRFLPYWFPGWFLRQNYSF